MRMTAAEFASRFPDHPEAKTLSTSITKTTRTRKIKGAPKAPSVLEATFALQVKAHKLPEPVTEHRFHPVRRWAFDFAWPELRLAVEIEGGVHSRGRHVRPKGFQNDIEKYNEATSLGWLVLRYTAQDLKNGNAIDQVMNLIEEKSRAEHTSRRTSIAHPRTN